MQPKKPFTLANLTLKTESLRVLTDDDLANVSGGAMHSYSGGCASDPCVENASDNGDWNGGGDDWGGGGGGDDWGGGGDYGGGGDWGGEA